MKLGESLDFLGFTFRYDRDLRGRAHRYLDYRTIKEGTAAGARPSERNDRSGKCYKPVTDMIEEVNEHLLGLVKLL